MVDTPRYRIVCRVNWSDFHGTTVVDFVAQRRWWIFWLTIRSAETREKAREIIGDDLSFRTQPSSEVIEQFTESAMRSRAGKGDQSDV